jgi:translation initiation factor 3 subunit A
LEVEKKGDAYGKKIEAAAKKIEQERAKRKVAVTKALEEEKARREKEEAEIVAREEERKQDEGESILQYTLFNPIYFPQLVSQKRNASAEKRKNDLPPKKLLSRRKKMKLLLNVRCARENVRKLWKRRASTKTRRSRREMQTTISC